MAEPFATKDTPPGFPMAISEYSDFGKTPRTLAEMNIILISAAIRDKPDWWTKILDDTILDRWEEEILERFPKAEIFEGKDDESAAEEDDQSAAEEDDQSAAEEDDQSAAEEDDEAWTFNYDLLQYAITETKW
jgi:hypothetical protein